ncbi:MAG: hypothetical protein MK089_02640 [Phycisphaerales bacterium]|nr:hypothetical protein [Phycisphaerales bacterium]
MAVEGSSNMFESPLMDLHKAEAAAPPIEMNRADAEDRPGASMGELGEPLELEFLPWGSGSDEQPACLVLATSGWVELEYAVMRRGCGLLDQPQRGTIVVRGEDRVEFLNRMVTQDLKDLSTSQACHGFLTDRKGRITAELILIETDQALFLDLDLHQIDSVCEVLRHHVFTEDVQIEDESDKWYRIGLHGPEIGTVLKAHGGLGEGHLGVNSLAIADADVLVVRKDMIGAPGCDLLLPREEVVPVWTAIRDHAQVLGIRTRAVGWYAFNTARLEGGTPLFNIDFGSTSLPHETGLVQACVSFTKGCYPGQEVVARMHNLGQPKQQLRGLRIDGDHLPVAGTQVFASEDEELSEPVGVITSSAISPLGGAAPMAFAMLRKRVVAAGTRVRMHAEGSPCEATVGELDVLGLKEEST